MRPCSSSTTNERSQLKITAAVTESVGAPFALRELELGELRGDMNTILVAGRAVRGIVEGDSVPRRCSRA